MRKKIFIIGDSHVDALKRVFKLNENFESDFSFEVLRLSKIKNGKQIGDISLDEALKRVSQLDKDDVIFSLLGGNQHSVLGLIQHPVKFDIHLGTDVPLGLDEACNYIPSNVLLDVFDTSLREHDFAQLSQINAHSPCAVYHVSAPPPKEDEVHILKRPDTLFTANGIFEKGVTKASLRLQLWLLQIKATKNYCFENGISFFAVPEQALCKAGFLKPEFYAADATHANHLFGLLILEEINSLVEQMPSTYSEKLVHKMQTVFKKTSKS